MVVDKQFLLTARALVGEENDTRSLCVTSNINLKELLLIHHEAVAAELKSVVFFDDINPSVKTHILIVADRDEGTSTSKALHAPEYSSKEVLAAFVRLVAQHVRTGVIHGRNKVFCEENGVRL